MNAPNADRNLLFGMLALQMDFIKQDQLVAGMHAWVLNKTHPLGEILIDRGVMTRERLVLLDALVQEHLKQHNDDTEMSLRAVSPGWAKAELQKIGDTELHATLCKMPSTPPVEVDPLDTLVGQSGSGVSGSMGASMGGSIGSPSSSGSRFRVLRAHARGGLGEVLLARDEELHREVALKQMQDRYADHPESRTRFVVEAEITGGLEHPGIVPVYGLGQYADGRPYYAMRFIRGDSLKDAIDKYHNDSTIQASATERGLRLRALLRCFVDVCQAMAYAHSRGVLHRDLKPGNVMLGKYGETLVVDWGLAKPIGQTSTATSSPEGSLQPRSVSGSTPTLDGSAVGTPQYMSPEQATGQMSRIGPASDVYSLGATLYCLLTGKPSMTDSDVGKVLSKVERGEFPPPRAVKADVPPALEAICLKAMRLVPEDRYESPTLLAEDLESWLADEPVSVYPEPWTKRAARWLRRHRTLALSTASAVIVALVGLLIATTLLAAANERERRAKMEALEQKDKAEKNFRMARDAVDRYHTEVSENVLLHEPGMEPLRKKLLEAAREFYERFASLRAGDPDVKGEWGRAQYRLAIIVGELEAEAPALALLEKARQVFADLDKEYGHELALSHHHLGRLHRKAKNLAPSRKAYEEALTVRQTLREADPKNVRDQAEWGRTSLGLGNVYLEEGQLTQAIAQYRQALAVRETLVAEDPKNVDYRRDLAVTHGNLALAYLDLGGKEKEAEEAFAAARDLLEGMVKTQPFISQYRDDLARTLYSLADLRRKREPADGALTLYEQARDHWSLLVGRHPSVLRFHVRLAEALGSLAELHNRGKRPEKALLAGREALETRLRLVEANPSASYRGDLARGHFQLAGIHAAAEKPAEAQAAFEKAAVLQEELVKATANAPEYRADLARTYNDLGLLLTQRNQLALAEKNLFRATELWEGLQRNAPDKAQYAEGLSAAAVNLRQLLRLGGDLARARERFTQNISALKSAKPSPAMERALGNVLWARAEVVTRLGEHALALADWNEAIAVAPASEKPWLRLYQAMTVASLGDHAKAAATADEFAKAGTKNGEALYLLSGVYSLSALAARKDARLPTKEREGQVNHYLQRGIEMFGRAQSAGHFRNPINRARLSTDPALEGLRSNAEFQQMLMKAMLSEPGV